MKNNPSADYRRAIIEKRDRLILAMSRDGRTQEAIGAELEVPRETVTSVIARSAEKRSTAQISKPQRATPPIVEWPEDMTEDLAAEAPAPGVDPVVSPAAQSLPARFWR